MKVLFDHHDPFLLAHGGFQVQIQETKRALEGLGVELEFLRWWDAAQCAEIIHFFGRPSGAYIDLAHKKNLRVVMAELLSGLAARSSTAIAVQKYLIRAIRNSLPYSVWAKMGWDAYSRADAVIALTNWEAELMQRVFGARADKVAIIPNGVANEFLEPVEVPRQDWLICTATITPRKRILETAQAAVAANVPLRVIGRPYADGDSYARGFAAFAARHSEVIKYEGAIDDRALLAEAYRQARGFVLLSTQESLSLSALEAAACRCPLLLSDLPWARTTFGDTATYCPLNGANVEASALRQFYKDAPDLKRPQRPMSWEEIARQLKTIYERVLSTSS